MCVHHELGHRRGVPLHLHPAGHTHTCTYTYAYSGAYCYCYTDTYSDAGAYCYAGTDGNSHAYADTRTYTYPGIVYYPTCSYRCVAKCDVRDVGGPDTV